MGLGPAFVKYGSAEAINLGGAGVPGFVVGNEAIGKFIGANAPQPTSPLHWGPDRTIVASSGDLGVTIGFVTENTAEAGQPGPRSFPFFTVWRRATATATVEIRCRITTDTRITRIGSRRAADWDRRRKRPTESGRRRRRHAESGQPGGTPQLNWGP